jgi:signal transduction histidine kinase
MDDLSLHLLDIAENSIVAHATRIDIVIIEDRGEDELIIRISDNGIGMDECMREKVLDPFFTTKPQKSVGLGLPLLAQAAEESGGGLTIESGPQKGTEIVASFTLSNIDRKPLGDMEETMRVLRATHPDIIFTYQYRFRD